MILIDTLNHLNPTNTMSSNMQIVKICEFCNKDFIARTTSSLCCYSNCSKRFYALKKRNAKIQHVELQTEIKRNAKTSITVEEIKIINVKQYLTLKEAALLLNITQLTLRRWTLAGKMTSKRIGKKHLFLKENLFT